MGLPLDWRSVMWGVGMFGLAVAAASAGEAGSPTDAAKPSQVQAATEAATATVKVAEAPAAPAAPVAKTADDPLEAFIEKSKHPVSWFRWGADFRFRDEYFNNVLTLNRANPATERNYLRYRPRWWGTITPLKGIDLNGRLVWEGRYYTRPDGHQIADWDQGEVLWDNFNLKWTDIGGSGLSVTGGRQDLKYGSGWLVLDGTSADGSRTTFFDAYRASYEARPIQTTFDAVFIHNKADPEDDWLRNLKDLDRLTLEQDQNGVIFYASNRSLAKTQIDGYYIYKDEIARARNGDSGHVHTFGSRVAGDLSEHWQYAAEGAHEFGTKNERTLQAYGFNGNVTYLFRDRCDDRLDATYEYLSGDDPHTRTNEQFDHLWGRWPLWSELWAYLNITEQGRYGDTTNLHRLSFGWSTRPAAKLEFSMHYHLLWADENTLGATAAGRARGFSQDESFRGNLFSAVLQYQFNPHVSAHLWGEFFFPWSYYLKSFNDPATWLRSQVVFTW